MLSEHPRSGDRIAVCVTTLSPSRYDVRIEKGPGGVANLTRGSIPSLGTPSLGPPPCTAVNPD